MLPKLRTIGIFSLLWSLSAGFLFGQNIPALSTQKKTSVSSNFYHTERRTEHRVDGPKSTVTFFNGEKKLWAEALETGCECENITIIGDTGRSFIKIKCAQVKRIRVYSKMGKKILDVPAEDSAVSSEGRFVACANPESEGYFLKRKMTVFLVDVDHDKKIMFETEGDQSLEAVSDNGKYSLLRANGSDTQNEKHLLVNAVGAEVWIKKGPFQFKAVEGHGKWISWFDGKKKTVDYCDFLTGETLTEIPFTKFILIYGGLTAKR